MSILRFVEKLLHNNEENQNRRLQEIPEINKVLTTISAEKFGLINNRAQEVVNAIYAQIKATGIYTEVGAGTFRQTGTGVELVVPSSLYTFVQDFRDFSRQLACCGLAPKGTVLLNTLSIYLGIAIVNDQYLKKYVNRRRLLIQSLHLERLPIGLYVCGSGEICTPKTIRPVVFFDVQRNQVDVLAYNALVKRLKFLVRKHSKDTELQNWCKLKLQELEILGQSLALQGKGFIPNKERLHA